MSDLDRCKQITDTESGRVLLYRDEVEEVLKAGDCISRREAIDAIKELCEHYTPTKSVTHPHMDFVIEELEALPSAQPEIIHCRDCKWWRDSDHTCGEHSLVSPMLANDFCSRAERRADG